MAQALGELGEIPLEVGEFQHREDEWHWGDRIRARGTP
jgi:hypothetical protein